MQYCFCYLMTIYRLFHLDDIYITLILLVLQMIKQRTLKSILRTLNPTIITPLLYQIHFGLIKDNNDNKLFFPNKFIISFADFPLAFIDFIVNALVLLDNLTPFESKTKG